MARTLTAALAAALLAVVPGAGAAPGAETPRRGGTVVALRLEPTCLNPFACPVLPDDEAITQVLEGAFEVGPDLVRRPNLVSGVDIGRKPFTLTYYIRPEARWSDGVPVTAADFLFTQLAFARLPTLASDDRELYGRVRRARVVDAKTFRVELRAPFSDWHSLYRVVLPRHALEGQDLTKVWIDGIDNPTTGRPIASGPFLVQQWERGKQLALGRNPRYWGPHTAYLDRLVFSFAQDRSDPLGPVRRNEFDVSLNLVGSFPLSEELARGVRQVPGWRTRAWPAPLAEHLVFRVAAPGGHPALRFALVRRALAFGIDREEIARAFLGEAERSSRRPLDSTVFLPTDPSYRAAWSGYRYDPARAQRLFRQAGCRLGADGIQICAGERLSLRFVTTPDSPARERTLLLVRAQLQRVGV
ncbi:MAG TPA: ABC transporter substrate-binding protein, partial [Gemmatimonadota bacterium]|nr:ABC transporter substrate-binding protein [Gemmatimonadota bacterium]